MKTIINNPKFTIHGWYKSSKIRWLIVALTTLLCCKMCFLCHKSLARWPSPPESTIVDLGVEIPEAGHKWIFIYIYIIYSIYKCFLIIYIWISNHTCYIIVLYQYSYCFGDDEAIATGTSWAAWSEPFGVIQDLHRSREFGFETGNQSCHLQNYESQNHAW